jgi:Tfp pilus assembly protein PilF
MALEVRLHKRIAPDILLALLVLLAYIPAYDAQFIWDDDAHLTANPQVVGAEGLRGIWTTSAATYYPLVLTTFWLQHAVWGLHPFPYHLFNVLLHALCGLLLRHVLLRLKACPAAAWLGAALWVLHPAQVETAAWITELKNTQSGVFYLLAILMFLHWREVPRGTRRRTAFYAGFLLCAAGALLSKTSTVMLPVVVALCAWWLDGRWRWLIVKPLLPFFALSAAAAAWTVWEQKFHSGALGIEWVQTIGERIAVAGAVPWFYLGKLLWPYPLIFIYPRWNVRPPGLLWFLPVAALLAVLIALWRYRNTTLRPLWFAFAYFVVSLFPVMNFFDVYFFRYSFVGDHFQYLAAMGPLALAGAAIAAALRKAGSPRYYAAVVTVLVAALAAVSADHGEVFKNNEVLWKHTIAKNPEAWLAHNNLATIFLDQSNVAAAEVELEDTLRLNPRYAEAHANLANILFDAGRFDEAITHFRQAIEAEPQYERMYNYLGMSLVMSGQMDEGVRQIRRAIELNPEDAKAHEHLGIALSRRGDKEGATAEFAATVRASPTSANYRMRYGTALLLQDKFAEAKAQFAEAVRLTPDFAPAHKLLGVALLELQEKDEAVRQLQEALRLDPSDGESREKLKQAQCPQRLCD